MRTLSHRAAPELTRDQSKTIPPLHMLARRLKNLGFRSSCSTSSHLGTTRCTTEVPRRSTFSCGTSAGSRYAHILSIVELLG